VYDLGGSADRNRLSSKEEKALAYRMLKASESGRRNSANRQSTLVPTPPAETTSNSKPGPRDGAAAMV